MAATPAALDELDEPTLELIVALQLEDIAAIEDQNPAESDPAAATRMHRDELLQYQAVRRLEGEETNLAETFATAASGRDEHFTCVSCEDHHQVDKGWQAPCSHDYCVDCLEQLHRSSMRDETLYPPRCCRRPMPWEDVRTKLSDDLVTSFADKKQELDVPVGQRTYCSDPNCAVFIGAAHITSDLATCPTCSNTTCTMCKAASHEGDCPADEALQETLRLATERGWQRCGHCRTMVDLTMGCYHMTCNCKHQFCYICAEPWKTCRCPQWDEDRLYVRAAAIAHREAPAGAAVNAEQIEQEAQNLRENHNCDHEEWMFSRGAGECEECGYEAPAFTYICRQCRIEVCRRCMQNRL